MISNWRYQLKVSKLRYQTKGIKRKVSSWYQTVSTWSPMYQWHQLRVMLFIHGFWAASVIDIQNNQIFKGELALCGPQFETHNLRRSRLDAARGNKKDICSKWLQNWEAQLRGSMKKCGGINLETNKLFPFLQNGNRPNGTALIDRRRWVNWRIVLWPKFWLRSSGIWLKQWLLAMAH